MTSELTGLRDAVARVGRAMAAAGLVTGTAGNLSARSGEHVAISATGAGLETLTRDEVVVVDTSGRQVAGELEPTSELALHLGVLADTGAQAVVHTHSAAACAVGVVADELPVLHYQQLLLGGAIRVAPFAVFGTPELATAVRAALDGRTAALLAHHGTVTHAASLPAALDAALLLEWCCELYLRALSTGRPVAALDADQQRSVVEAALRRGYGTTRPATPSPHLTEENA